jgi:hypothetical protein
MSERAAEEPQPAILTGGCNCGAVRFEVTAPLVVAHYCHCRRCQRRTGTAASLNARAAPGGVRVSYGRDRLRAWKPDDGREKWFCGDCGSALFSSASGFSDPIGVRMGAFDDDPGIRPSARFFTAFAAPWEPIPDDGLPHFSEKRPRTGR